MAFQSLNLTFLFKSEFRFGRARANFLFVSVFDRKTSGPHIEARAANKSELNLRLGGGVGGE